MLIVQAHSTKSKQDMTAREYFPSPRPVEELVIKQNKSVIGKAFKAKAKEVQAALDALSGCEQDALQLKVRHALAHTTWHGEHIFQAILSNG